MELHQLRTFVTVAEEGHLTRASERLCVSQPAVSGHIKTLEEEFGVPLFHRTPRGMTLTREGEGLLERAKRIIGETEQLLGAARGMSGALNGQVALGINTDSTFLRLGEISAQVRRDYPGIALSLVNANSWDIAREVRRGAMDAGFVYGKIESADLHVTLLARVPFHVVGPAAWEQRVGAASWNEIATMPWVWMSDNCPFHDVLDGRFAALGLTPCRCVEGDHEDILRVLVVAGEGLTLMREDEAMAGRACGQLCIWSGDRLMLPLSFICRDVRQNDPVLRAVRNVVVSTWSENDVLEHDTDP